MAKSLLGCSRLESVLKSVSELRGLSQDPQKIFIYTKTPRTAASLGNTKANRMRETEPGWLKMFDDLYLALFFFRFPSPDLAPLPDDALFMFSFPIFVPHALACSLSNPSFSLLKSCIAALASSTLEC